MAAYIINSVLAKFVPITSVEFGLVARLVYNTTEYGDVQCMCLRKRLKSWILSLNYVIS